jgi:hypothetical protein
MQQWDTVRPEWCEHQINVFREEVGIFIDDENSKIVGDAGGKRQPPHAVRSGIAQMK